MADAHDTSDSEIFFNMNKHVEGGNGGYYVDHDGNRQEQVYRGRGGYRRHVNIMPDPYTGEEDWDQYIAYFDDCAELAQWTDNEKILYLATSLKHRPGYTIVHCLFKRNTVTKL